MDRIAEAGEQAQPRGAPGRIGIVDRNRIEKRIDRRAQACQRGHGLGEVFRLDGSGSAGACRGERLNQRGFGRFGGVGKG